MILFILFAFLFILGAFQFQTFSFNLNVGSEEDASFVSRFYAPEKNAEFDFRWTKDVSYLNLYQVGTPYRLTFRAATVNPNSQSVTLSIAANGQEIGQVKVGQTAGVFTINSARPIWGPEDLSLRLKVAETFDETGQSSRKNLGIALDWLKVEPYRNRLGLIVPPPFQWLWWVCFACWPLFLLKFSRLNVTPGIFYLAGLLNLVLAAALLVLPFTSTHTHWFLTGLSIAVLEAGLSLAWLGLKVWRTKAKQTARKVLPSGSIGLLLLALGLLYLASARGRLSYGDDRIMEGVTAAIVSGNPAAPLTRFLRLEGDPTFAPYGIGLSLVAVPFYLLGVGASNLFPAMYSEQVGSAGLTVYVLLLTNLVLTVASIYLFYRLLKRLNFTTGPALASSALYGLGTMAWHYARTFLSEPLVTFCLLTALLCSLKYRQAANWKWTFLIGFMLGLAVATRINNLIVLPFYALYLVWAWWEREDRLKGGLVWQSLKRALRDGVCFGAGIGFWLLIINWYNLARYSSAITTGYTLDSNSFDTPLWTGLYGQLFSTGKSIFLYNPVLILGLLGLPFALKRHRSFSLLCLGIIAAYLTLYGTWLRNGWLGGGVWGLRFLVPLLPLFLWPSAYLFTYLGQKSSNGTRLGFNWMKAATLTLILLLTAASLLVQFLSIIVNYQIYEAQYGRSDKLFQLAIYNLADSPIVVHWKLWLDQTRPDLASRFYNETPFARLVDFTQEFALWSALGCSFLSLVAWVRVRLTSGEKDERSF